VEDGDDLVDAEVGPASRPAASKELDVAAHVLAGWLPRYGARAGVVGLDEDLGEGADRPDVARDRGRRADDLRRHLDELVILGAEGLEVEPEMKRLAIGHAGDHDGAIERIAGTHVDIEAAADVDLVRIDLDLAVAGLRLDDSARNVGEEDAPLRLALEEEGRNGVDIGRDRGDTDLHR